jgi:hypothetical protein
MTISILPCAAARISRTVKGAAVARIEKHAAAAFGAELA